MGWIMKQVLLAVLIAVLFVVIGNSAEQGMSVNVPYDDSGDNGTDGWHDNMDIYGYAVETIEPNKFISQILTDLDVRISPGRIKSVVQTGGPKVAFNFSNNMASMNFISPKDTGYERTLTFKAVLDNNEEVPFRFTVLSSTFYELAGDFSCKDQDTGEIDEECLNREPESVELYGVHNLNVWKINEPLGIEIIPSGKITEFSVFANNDDDASEITDWFDIVKERIVLKSLMSDKFKKLKDMEGKIVLYIYSNINPDMEIDILVGDASVSGHVLRKDGSAATEAFNLPVIFYNYFAGYKKRYVTNVDAKGNYSIKYLPAGRYSISSGDINLKYYIDDSTELVSGKQTVLRHELMVR
jgi:hypothetical protein